MMYHKIPLACLSPTSNKPTPPKYPCLAARHSIVVQQNNFTKTVVVGVLRKPSTKCRIVTKQKDGLKTEVLRPSFFAR